MRAAQARFQQEQQCQQLQQQAAALGGQVHMLTGRCEAAESDAQALQQRLGLEAERVRLHPTCNAYLTKDARFCM